MKIIRAMILLAGTASLAADPGQEAVRHVRVQVEYFELSLDAAAALLDNEEAASSGTAMRRHIGLLAKRGTARLVDAQLLVARSDEKAVQESGREHIYPTEYEPSEVSKAVVIHPDGSEAKGVFRDSATGPTPTAFETRKLGSELEIEPNILRQPGRIALHLAPQTTYHTGNTTFSTWKDTRGTADVTMPDFYTLRFVTHLVVPAGKHVFVATLSPKDPHGRVDPTRKLMVFLKADIITPLHR